MALLPFAVTSLGLQITLGRVLGDSTDEGLDARTSYQFLAAFFGSMLVWPVVAGVDGAGLVQPCGRCGVGRLGSRLAGDRSIVINVRPDGGLPAVFSRFLDERQGVCCCVGRVGGHQEGMDSSAVSKGRKSATERLLTELNP